MDVSTINLRVLGALLPFASKEETRYYLNGVLVEISADSTVYVATDGTRLLTYRDELAPDAARNALTGCFIIPSAHCKPVKLGKDHDGYAKIFRAEGGSRLTIASEFVDVTFAPIDGTYPDWRRTIPAASVSGQPGQFNVSKLADFAKASKALDAPLPFIAHNGTESPALIWFPGTPQLVGVIMPFRMTDATATEPAQWLRKGPEREQHDLEDAADAKAVAA